MRQNRKVSRKRSVIGMHVMHLGGVLLIAVGLLILNMLAESTCGQLRESIGRKDRLLQARQAELDRAKARWEATKSTDNLDRALGRRGLMMNFAKANQIIKIDGNTGKFVPGQRSVALAHQRRDRLAAAMSTSAAPATRRARSN